MPITERLKNSLGVIAKRLGLQPERFKTEEEAQTDFLRKFLEGEVDTEAKVLTLPEEEKQDQPPSDI